MKKSTWEIIESIVQLLILIVMAIAINQTSKMISINEEQSEKSTLPVIIFDVQQISYFKSQPIIRNVGVGPAFNIKVNDYNNRDYLASFQLVTGLEKDGLLKLDYEIYDHRPQKDFISYVDTFENDFYKFISYRGHHFMGRTSQVTLDSNFVITYFDIKGNKYKIAEKARFDLNGNKFMYKIDQFPTKQK